jgi:hypothetical protein
LETSTTNAFATFFESGGLGNIAEFESLQHLICTLSRCNLHALRGTQADTNNRATAFGLLSPLCVGLPDPQPSSVQPVTPALADLFVLVSVTVTVTVTVKARSAVKFRFAMQTKISAHPQWTAATGLPSKDT